MRRVLVIGTDTALVRDLESSRSRAQYDLVTVPGSVEALQVLRARSFDVVVTDPTTTVREDLALLQEMRGIRPGLRAIVLAPATLPTDVIEALRARVYALFSPTFVTDEIASMIENALDQDRRGDAIELTSDLPHWLTVRLSCNLVDAERLVGFMSELRSDVTQSDRDDLLVAFREVLMNAMEHGCGFDADKVIEVTAARTGRAIVYHFRDPGSGFDREALPHAAISNPPDNPLAHAEYRTQQGLRPGGFGILIAKQLVDEMTYNGPGNEVILVKYTDQK